MADPDPAFLWETEALRMPAAARTARQPSVPQSDWLTLRQASDATGIPVSTLRNWARKGRIPTSLDEKTPGAPRMVSLEAVRARARQLGAGWETVGGAAGAREASEQLESQVPLEQDQVPSPPGTVLVPIEAWDKMLHQLGNLHEAGQQLAEARERAARAETEAAFLRERLAEHRARSSTPGTETEPAPPTGDQPPDRDEPEPKPARMPSFTAYLWRIAVSDRRRR